MSYKAGFVGFLGLPNAGKSTFLNRVLGAKLAGVSAKPQTTRQRNLGLLNADDFQAVLVDAPGQIEAHQGLNHFLQQEFEAVATDSDVNLVLLNIDAKNPQDLFALIHRMEKLKKPWGAVITKTDLPDKQRIGILRSKLLDFGVPVIESSRKKTADRLREDLKEVLRSLLPESPGPLYDPQLLTPARTRDICSELIRENCFRFLHSEIPYGLAVRVNQFEEGNKNLVKIFADIVVSKSNHRAIVVGNGGQSLKRIGLHSRKEIERLCGRKVYLDLHVTARPGWVREQKWLEEFGYVTN